MLGNVCREKRVDSVFNGHIQQQNWEHFEIKRQLICKEDEENKTEIWDWVETRRDATDGVEWQRCINNRVWIGRKWKNSTDTRRFFEHFLFFTISDFCWCWNLKCIVFQESLPPSFSQQLPSLQTLNPYKSLWYCRLSPSFSLVSL